MPASPTVLKARLSETLARVESLELLEDLREKNLINEELKDQLECYSGKMEILI